MGFTQPLFEAVMVYVTVSTVNPLFVIVWRISPIPESGNPVRFMDDGEAVQLNVVPVIVEVRMILVIPPEQMDGVVELMIISGSEPMFTVSFLTVPVQPFRVGVKWYITVPGSKLETLSKSLMTTALLRPAGQLTILGEHVGGGFVQLKVPPGGTVDNTIFVLVPEQMEWVKGAFMDGAALTVTAREIV